MMAIDMVEDIGHKAIEARSGRQALEILKTMQPIDLLLTDHAMPGMSGLELARLAQDLRPELPVLLVTGYGDFAGGEITDLPRLGKPYHQSQLEAEIARLLRR
jgi:CheY-like chemotaxis protein